MQTPKRHEVTVHKSLTFEKHKNELVNKANLHKWPNRWAFISLKL